MSARQGGSLATLMLVIPLSAIPLMAIFGIPDFAHLSAATSEAPPDLVRQPSASFEEPAFLPTSADEHHRRAAADLLSPNTAQTPRNTPQAPSDAAWGDRAASSDGHVAATAAPPVATSSASSPSRPSPRPMQTAAPQPLVGAMAGGEATPVPTATASGLTWREATRKLDEVGITDYHLERGDTSDRFLFVCRFSPGGDQRIVQRFEAEAAEPLEAVEDVLGQVDQWLQHRFADSRRWLP